MATQGTGREMEKKGQESSENFTAMLLTGEKNMAIAAIAWFPDVSSYFLFSICFSSSALERPQSRRKKLNLPRYALASSYPPTIISLLPISTNSRQNRGSEKIGALVCACSLRTAIDWLI